MTDDVVYATRLPFDPGSPAVAFASRVRTASYVEGFWSPSLVRSDENGRLKQTLIAQRPFSARSTEGLSLSGGASIRSRACSS
jgi:hypothetical protein